MFCQEAESRLLLTSPNFGDSVGSRWDCFHGIDPRRSHYHVVDGWVADYREVNDFSNLFCHDWEFYWSKGHRRYTWETGQRLWDWYDFSQLYVHPFESITEDDVNRTPCVNEDSCDFDISDDKVDDERIIVRLVYPICLCVFEGNCAVRGIARWRPDWIVGTCLGLPLIRFDGRDWVVIEMRFSNDHVHRSTVRVVTFVVKPSSALFSWLFFSRLIFRCGISIPVCPWRPVRVQKEVLCASHLG